jgi:signal transduction histidine kinase/cytidylate kinase
LALAHAGKLDKLDGPVDFYNSSSPIEDGSNGPPLDEAKILLGIQIHDLKNKFVAAAGLLRIAVSKYWPQPKPKEIIDALESLKLYAEITAGYLRNIYEGVEMLDILRDEINLKDLIRYKKQLELWKEIKYVNNVIEALDAGIEIMNNLYYSWLGHSMSFANIKQDIEQLLNNFSQHYEDEGIELVKEIDLPEDMVATYKEIILRNAYELLYNAYKYGDRKKIIFKAQVIPGNFLLITVTNFGKVIPSAVLLKIFDAGYRLQDEKAGLVEGTGFGLSGVKKDTLSVGGWIKAESEALSGTRFSFAVPLNASLDILPNVAYKLKNKLLIVISGLAGSGRRILARSLAAGLGLRYINMGFLLRVIFYYLLKENPQEILHNEERLAFWLEDFFKRSRIDFMREPLTIDGISTLEKTEKGISLRTEIKVDIDQDLEKRLAFYRFAELNIIKEIISKNFRKIIHELEGEQNYSGFVIRSTEPWQNVDSNIMLEAKRETRALRLKTEVKTIELLDENTARLDFGPHKFAGYKIYNIDTEELSPYDIYCKKQSKSWEKTLLYLIVLLR